MTPEKTVNAGKTVNAAAIQWDVKRGDVAVNLDTAVELLEGAAQGGVELAVLPEMWASSFMVDGGASVRDAIADAERRITELSGDLGLIVVGTNYEFAKDDRRYNRALVLERGVRLGAYRKMHLFSPQGEDRDFAGGERPLVVDTQIGRMGVAICYDLRFPELIRHLYSEGAELLVVPAQWPEPRETHWRVLARARAIENQWFVVAANRCGVEASLVNDRDIAYPGNSIIVDPAGNVLAAGNGTPGAVLAQLELKETAIVRRAIPVGKDRRPDVYARFRSER